jgi:hypothetical protein
MIIRRDLDVETIGVMAALPEDLSPITIGTSGRFADAAFTVRGGLLLDWEQGAWTEWFVEFNEGERQGWLAEAQGLFAVSFEEPVELDLDVGQLTPGVAITVNDHRLTVTDIKQTICRGAVGELPFPAPQGRQGTSVDLATPDGGFACLEFYEGGVRFFVGRYCSFNELQLTGLKPVPGWFWESSFEFRNWSHGFCLCRLRIDYHPAGWRADSGGRLRIVRLDRGCRAFRPQVDPAVPARSTN